jgi:hypothetical protein
MTGGFHKWGYPQEWMVFMENPIIYPIYQWMTGGTPMAERKPPWLFQPEILLMELTMKPEAVEPPCAWRRLRLSVSLSDSRQDATSPDLGPTMRSSFCGMGWIWVMVIPCYTMFYLLCSSKSECVQYALGDVNSVDSDWVIDSMCWEAFGKGVKCRKCPLNPRIYMGQYL